jgi:hypothetical protein
LVINPVVMARLLPGSETFPAEFPRASTGIAGNVAKIGGAAN